MSFLFSKDALCQVRLKLWFCKIFILCFHYYMYIYSPCKKEMALHLHLWYGNPKIEVLMYRPGITEKLFFLSTLKWFSPITFLTKRNSHSSYMTTLFTWRQLRSSQLYAWSQVSIQLPVTIDDKHTVPDPYH